MLNDRVRDSREKPPKTMGKDNHQEQGVPGNLSGPEAVNGADWSSRQFLLSQTDTQPSHIITRTGPFPNALKPLLRNLIYTACTSAQGADNCSHRIGIAPTRDSLAQSWPKFSVVTQPCIYCNRNNVQGVSGDARTNSRRILESSAK